MAESVLKDRLKERAELLVCAEEVLRIVTTDELLRTSRESVEAVKKMNSKVNRGKENTTDTIETLEKKKSEMEQAIATNYDTVMRGVPLETPGPDRDAVKFEIQKAHKEAKGIERDFKKMENEKKILEFHKKHRKLQKKIAPVHFDMSSTSEHVKGYITKPQGELQTFEFDFTKDSPCYIADFLWDNI